MGFPTQVKTKELVATPMYWEGAVYVMDYWKAVIRVKVVMVDEGCYKVTAQVDGNDEPILDEYSVRAGGINIVATMAIGFACSKLELERAVD